MPIIYDTWPGQEKVKKSKTVTIDSGKIPGTGVVAYFLNVGGATQLQHIDRLILKAGGTDILNMPQVMLRSWAQRFARGNAVLGAAAQNIPLPLFFPDLKGDDRYARQFPPGQTPLLQIQFGAGATDDDPIDISWAVATGIKPLAYPMLLSEQHKIAKSASRDTWKISRPGLLRSVSLPTAGLLLGEFTLSNLLLFRGSGAAMQTFQRTENSETLTLSDPVTLKIHEPQAAAVGSSQFVAKTDAGWDDAGEIMTEAMIPLAA